MVNSFSEVFITDGHWRKTLAATRALGKYKLPVTVGESAFLSTAGFSKYCRKRIVYPSPYTSPLNFIDFIHEYCKKNHPQMLLPMEDTTLELLAGEKKLFEKLTRLPIASKTKLRKARNKGGVIHLAESLGIPVPKTWQITTLDQLDTIGKQLPYPVVIKPNVGSGAMGVVYPRDHRELMEQYQVIHNRFPFPLIQEKIPTEGAGFGASFLLDEASEPKAVFIHKRLREYPVTGGASTARVSIRHDIIREMAENLLKAMNWYGIAMVEFKIDPRDNTPKLMEINPRFWGSLALAIESGVNFPYLLLKMARGEGFDPVDTYKTGVTCRWLLPGDMLHFLFNRHRHKIMPDFFRFRGDDLYYDIVSLTDPLPAIVKMISPVTFLYDVDMQARLKARQ